MRYSKIVETSYVDGPGARTVLFVQGCSLRCPGCQNKHLWNPDGGNAATPRQLAHNLTETGLPITISGGEPFDQIQQLADLLEWVRVFRASTHIIVYTGYTLEELLSTCPAEKREALVNVLMSIDVLVDGPYIEELDHDGIQYRGSSNQRAIDMPKAVGIGMKNIAEGDVPTLDWDTPELIVTEDGDVLGAAGVVTDYFDNSTAARRCGQCTSKGA